MLEEHDYVIFEDEDGTEFEFDIVDLFSYHDREYAVLVNIHDLFDDEGNELPDYDEEPQELYVMEVVEHGDEEPEFFSVEDAGLLDELAELIQERLYICHGDGEPPAQGIDRQYN